MEQQYAINDRTTVPAVLLERPDEVKAVQRRNHYRVRVREEDGLQVHVWRLGEQAQLCDRPVRGAELEARLHDLSVGGVGLVLLPKDGQSPKVLAGERVAMLLRTDAGENLLIEGRMRLAAPSEVRPDEAPSPVRAGVHFQKLDEAVEGRRTLQALTKIVGALQTQELRRQRLALI
jgi:c-di-GMP-binding flagellar brake protein YcgR